jgi:3-methyladenine DNA glycosylase AlkD
MTGATILAQLQSLANPANVAGMARFGISSQGTLGVSVAEIRRIARSVGRNHELAQEMWASGIHEARILATIVDEPARVTRRQMDQWARDFDSWDVCDQACQNLFWRTEHAWPMVEKWSGAHAEFVRRAGFALIARLASKQKDTPEERWEEALRLIVQAATDERNFVRKAVNWALREIGGRTPELRRRAIATAKQIRAIDSKAARWIAADALRELDS